ncbi:hypothetical protein N658DRAFT_490567 [Parathielavia hyrcaniae]|uniref:Uncharacterized protein n=1 Tax=Parathielavia hyrcaniae TaxID=113614 RepID=A0AAN6QEG8_9PEZI|nr:hypothetical protein N658DRAFT_490567 [Parathielavia hyrcaniae]
MERNRPDKSGIYPDTRTAPLNPRVTSQLVINSASQRRSLFSRPSTKDEPARPPSSGSASDGNAASPNKTRIPRPSQRPAFTISDAYRLAEEEEVVAQASPSPAPRFWRARRESTAEKRTTTTGSPGALGLPQRSRLNGKPPGGAKGSDSQDDGDVPSQQADFSASAFDEKLYQYAHDRAGSQENGRHSNGMISRPRLGTSSPRTSKTTTISPSLLRRLSGRPRESSDAVDNAPLRPSSALRAARDTDFQDSQTPNRSFAWQADADFTAGDVQFSNSPPVAVSRSNRKIDEIRALEAEIERRIPEVSGNEAGPVNKIGALETGVSHRAADEALDSDEARVADQDEVPDRRPVSRASMRIDELRTRETESLSRRALATARLGEYRERHLETSRSPSPDIARKPSKEAIRAFSPLRGRLRKQDSEPPAATVPAEQNQGAQGTLDPGSLNHGHSPAHRADASHTRRVSRGEKPHREASPKRDESRDILRRLAAARSSSPTREAQVTADSQAPTIGDREPLERPRQRQSIGGAKSIFKASVGFAGLSRSPSVESRLSTKRASFVHSDSDPTERIEQEMKLFAAQDNQSERGSLRVPSPEPEEEKADETPKPVKVDPLTQPTPRVTGAFVETPATVKVEKLEAPPTAQAAEKDTEPEKNGTRRLSTTSGENPKLLPARSEKEILASRQQKRTRSSTGDRALGRPTSLSARRRARSLSRSRVPLINTVKPPTVKDDLLEIQRVNQIDDSTLDDIAGLLDLPAPPIAPSLGSRGPNPETSDNAKFDREKELEAYDRMSRSLETGLLGIRSAKQGIERLEKEVTDADVKKEHPSCAARGEGIKKGSDGAKGGESPSCPVCQGSSQRAAADSAVTYIHLPLPRLFHRRPKFRFTLLGLVLFLLSLWYLAESCMCFWFCKPEYCYPGMPCDWSSDDPVWGYAIPVKLDQWITGGQGKDLAHRFRPEVEDWLADVRDAATGTDITNIDTSRYTWQQKRQHRRRLAKRGLNKPFVETPEDRAVLSGWRSVREANERVQSAQEMGYEVEEEESITADESL